MSKHDDFAARILKYMADMGMDEAMTDQDQNQTMRLVGQFAERERRRIRRLQAMAVHGLRDAIGHIDDADIRDRVTNDIAEVDAATKAPRRRRR